MTLLEVAEPEEVPAPQEAPAQEVAVEGAKVDLPVCQDHQAATILKGKPRSILSLLPTLFINAHEYHFGMMH